MILDDDWAYMDYILSFIKSIMNKIRFAHTDWSHLGEIYVDRDSIIEKIEVDSTKVFFKRVLRIIVDC